MMADYTDYMGVYDEYTNLLPNQAPAWVRTQAAIGLFKIYDKAWTPVMQDIFPKMQGPKVGGQTITVDDPFIIPIGADPQFISRFMDRFERNKEREWGIKNEIFWTRLIKEAGPTQDPTEFKNVFKSGFLDRKNQMLIQGAARAMSRKLEYELLGYGSGNAATIDYFSTQSTNRLKKVDVTSGAVGLTGVGWETTATANPVFDITKLSLWIETMAGVEAKRGFIGPNTAFVLEHNKDIKDQIKYHVDATKTVIASTLKNITFKKVIAQTYKENPTANSERVGYPGFGDMREDNWAARNKIPMMRTVSGADTYEWAMFTSGEPVGVTMTSRTMEKHKNTNVPFPHSWKDPEFEIMYSNMQFAFCPIVQDFGKIVIMDKICKVGTDML